MQDLRLHLLACVAIVGCQTDPSSGGGTGSTGEGSSSSGVAPADESSSDGADTTAAATSSSSEGGESSSSSDGADSDSSDSSTGPGCVPGEEEGCVCDDQGECGVGLGCEADVCVPIDCGNGTIEPPEECDDANGMNNDGCDNDCTLSSGAAAVYAGDEHACVTFHTGDIKCWGNHESGRLGYPMQGEDIGDDETPAGFGFVDVGGPVIELALGSNFSCALLEGEVVRCWGSGGTGRLGQGDNLSIGIFEAPSTVDPISLGGNAISIAAGTDHACAAMADGSLRCWGSNEAGQVGIPDELIVGDNELPSDLPPVNVGANVLQVAAGDQHTCAILGGGDVRCWGRNDLGQLGVPSIIEDIGDNEDPAGIPLVELDTEVVNISARFDHTCVSFVTGDVQCWGAGGSGRLGYGDENNLGDVAEVDSMLPLDLGFGATHLATGHEHTCVRLSSTGVFCWGEGDNGRLGLGTTDDVLAPLAEQVDVSKPQGPGDVAAGAAFTCTRTQGSEVKCWGRNNRGQIGQGAAFPFDLGDSELIASVGPIELE